MCEPEHDLPYDEYILCMAQRCAEVANGFVQDFIQDCKDVLEDLLRDEKQEFGKGDWDWCKQAAFEMADELLLQYWDES